MVTHGPLIALMGENTPIAHVLIILWRLGAHGFMIWVCRHSMVLCFGLVFFGVANLLIASIRRTLFVSHLGRDGQTCLAIL